MWLSVPKTDSVNVDRERDIYITQLHQDILLRCLTPSCSISSGFQGLKKCAWSLESMTLRLWSLKARLKLELRKMHCRDSESQPRVPWKSHLPKSDLAHTYWTVTEALISGSSLLICVCLYIQTLFFKPVWWLFSIIFPFFVWELFAHWGLHDIPEQVFILYCVTNKIII